MIKYPNKILIRVIILFFGLSILDSMEPAYADPLSANLDNGSDQILIAKVKKKKKKKKKKSSKKAKGSGEPKMVIIDGAGGYGRTPQGHAGGLLTLNFGSFQLGGGGGLNIASMDEFKAGGFTFGGWLGYNIILSPGFYMTLRGGGAYKSIRGITITPEEISEDGDSWLVDASANVTSIYPLIGGAMHMEMDPIHFFIAADIAPMSMVYYSLQLNEQDGHSKSTEDVEAAANDYMTTNQAKFNKLSFGISAGLGFGF